MAKRLTPDVNSRQEGKLTPTVILARDFSAHHSEMATNYIRKWRLHMGLSLEALADRMETTPGDRPLTPMSISRIERGEQACTLDHLEAFASALGVQPASLISETPSDKDEIVDLIARIPSDERELIIKMIKAAVPAE